MTTGSESSPTDLVEIRSWIGAFLQPSDLFACAQVSFAWQSTFLPLHWRHVTLDCSSQINPIPPIRLLSQHRSYIRSLTFKNEVSARHSTFTVEPNLIRSNDDEDDANTANCQVGPIISVKFLRGSISRSMAVYLDFIKLFLTRHRSTLKHLRLQDFDIPEGHLRNIIFGHNFNQESNITEWVPSDKGPWSGLRHFTLSIKYTIDSSEWDLLLIVFQNLESLELAQIELDPYLSQQMDAKYKTSCRVDRNDTVTPPRDQQRPDKQFRWLKRVRLTGLGRFSSLACLRALIVPCPMLNSLSWTIKKGQAFPGKEFSRVLSSGAWPNLAELELSGSMTKIEDHLLAQILIGTGVESTLSATSTDASTRVLKGKSLGRQASLKRLCVPYSKFSGASTMALLDGLRHHSHGHSTTLRELDLWRCDELSSLSVQRLLTNCPNLESFSANRLDLAEAILPEPWVCVRLRRLALYFDLGRIEDSWTPGSALKRAMQSGTETNQKQSSEEQGFDHDDLQRRRIIYSHLARLQRLEVMNLTRAFRPRDLVQRVRAPAYFECPPTLRFQLEEGLGELATLVNLRRLTFPNGVKHIGIGEARWMVQHWPALEHLDLNYSRGPLSDDIRQVFESRGKDTDSEPGTKVPQVLTAPATQWPLHWA
ncbi:hypothetical protein BGZ98_000247 [Dissophora globulifera]|nr:hypothetical protein BGZ98_000247 [Dissophora globulifera]